MMLRGFSEDRGSRTDVREGGTARASIADTTTGQGNGIKSLQLQKMRECEWKGQNVNNRSQCFKTGKITEGEKVGVLLGTEDNDRDFNFRFYIYTGPSVSEIYHLLFIHLLPYPPYPTGQTLTIKIFTCSDKSNNRTR